MSLLRNGSAFIISIILLILLCIIIQKNIVSEIISPVKLNNEGELLTKQNNPYGDQNTKEEIRRNLQYVTNCPDYWTPYYDSNGNFTCVSDNPAYNNKMNTTLSELSKNDNNEIKKLDFTPQGIPYLAGKGDLTPEIMNNINKSAVVSQNKTLYYIPNSSEKFKSGDGNADSQTYKSSWNSKCNWTQETCLPWSGINSSYSKPAQGQNTSLQTCEINSKCLNQNTKIPQKPKPNINTSKSPIYFYNYALGNNEAVNTNYIPNLYDANLLQDRSVDLQRQTGLLQTPKITTAPLQSL